MDGFATKAGRGRYAPTTCETSKRGVQGQASSTLVVLGMNEAVFSFFSGLLLC